MLWVNIAGPKRRWTDIEFEVLDSYIELLEQSVSGAV